ncbi:1-aminocyclopropane-1-carboxylate oxidase homolog 4-like [Chenopodium quinoa]|uniref:Fe2OG dioxygenase domain-containing protein n=1 Tax=Chenopodium quinoa TaxID=63459 RepID=A0A803N9W9_CHEQI|nr:1-aminocyclopropane-1-carboxylate oxidase homolog 4-like [Chenopodium quinoa]
MTTNTSSISSLSNYNRDKELQEFDNTKLGVKGLVDSGITQIPRIFHHPPDTLFHLSNTDSSSEQDQTIPFIDLLSRQPEIVQSIRDASAKFGFFQVINHGISVCLLDRLLDKIKAFHELPPEQKIPHYRRDTTTCSSGGVGFYSNFDLFQSDAASWRDTLEIRLEQFDPKALPEVCREEVIEWDKEVKQLAKRLMRLLSEGLGLITNKLLEMSCIERRLMVGQYYPHCPEPNKTVGITAHTDLETLTILLQDQCGGLQVNCHGKWIDVKPVQGALVVSIGDTLQMICNDEYKSGEHRVFANCLSEPRVSVAVFFDPGISEIEYGPLPELVSQEKPALYQQFKFSDVLYKGLDTGLEGEGKYTINYFRL